MAASDSGDSEDETVLYNTLHRGDNTMPPVSSPHTFTQHARPCPNARNSKKQKYTGGSDFTASARASVSSPTSALEADSIPHRLTPKL
jgi:hypothetical protein